MISAAGEENILLENRKYFRTCQGAVSSGADILLSGAPVRLANCRISASEDDHPGDHHGGTGDTEDGQQDLLQSRPSLQPALSHQDGLSSTNIQAVRKVDKYLENLPLGEARQS